MCLLLMAVRQHPRYPLVIAANRDEFFARPTAGSGFWSDNPELLAGRDLKAGGSWMGMTLDGRIAALTNIRDPASQVAGRQSRGEVVVNYLKHAQNSSQYLADLRQRRQVFNGYNLLFGHWHRLGVYNNALDSFHALEDGFYGLSNGHLHSGWPKTTRGVDALSRYCQRATLSTEPLFALLRDERQAADHLLPETGVDLAWERRLSSIFIRGQDYGTRSSTLLLVDERGYCQWHERSFDAQAQLIREFHTEFRLGRTR